MRARDYQDPSDVYSSWSHTDMIRAALVEGLHRKKAIDGSLAKKVEVEAQRYRRLLKSFTDEGLHTKIDKTFNIIQRDQLTNPQKGLVHHTLDLLGESDAWKRLDHTYMEDQGVIVRVSPSGLSELVDKLYHTPEDKVIVVEDIPLEDKDFLKHVPNHNKMIMNGKSAIKSFAQEKGFDLPESYLRYGRMTNAVRDLLIENSFTFSEAFQNSVSLMRDNPNRFYSIFTIKNSDGNESRFLPYELVAGTELFIEISRSRRPGRNITMRHGKNGNDFKYFGTNIFNVPKRKLFLEEKGARSPTHNEVELRYIQHLERSRDMTLEWMETRSYCNCDSALNSRNFEIRNGNTVRSVSTMEAHGRAALMYAADDYRPDTQDFSLMLYPTAGLYKLVDRFRFNLSNGKKSVGAQNIAHLTNEALKIDRPFEAIFANGQCPSYEILNPQLLVRAKHKLRY